MAESSDCGFTWPWYHAPDHRQAEATVAGTLRKLARWTLAPTGAHAYDRFMTSHLIPPKLPNPLDVGMLLYPGFTLLDLVGPQAVLDSHARTHLVAETLDPVMSDAGIPLTPTATFETCPKQLDVLFVPGGFGTAASMGDAAALRWLAERGQTASWVTSVCSGSLLLAAAGLLKGYRATTHWAALDLLESLGIETVRGQRVVVDRNRVSGGGVTAGIDFGLTLLATLRGETAAKMTQLMIEYAPAPPFDAGTPQTAGPEITGMVLAAIAHLDAETRMAAAAAH